MLAHRLIEAAALGNRIVNRQTGRLEFRVLGRIAKNLERLEHRHAVGQQIGQLGTEVGNLLFLDPDGQLQRKRSGLGIGLLQTHRIHRLSSQLLHRLGARRSGDQTRELLSGARFCGVSEFCHDKTVPGSRNP